MERLDVVGKREPMLDAWEKATGRARFTDDLVLPGMLYGKILRSPLAHAKILHVDLSKAEKVAGVKGAIHGEDIPKRKYGIVPMAKDEYALAVDKVRYIGDEVAAAGMAKPSLTSQGFGSCMAKSAFHGICAVRFITPTVRSFPTWEFLWCSSWRIMTSIASATTTPMITCRILTWTTERQLRQSRLNLWPE